MVPRCRGGSQSKTWWNLLQDGKCFSWRKWLFCSNLKRLEPGPPSACGHSSPVATLTFCGQCGSKAGSSIQQMPRTEWCMERQPRHETCLKLDEAIYLYLRFKKHPTAVFLAVACWMDIEEWQISHQGKSSDFSIFTLSSAPVGWSQGRNREIHMGDPPIFCTTETDVAVRLSQHH